MHSVKLATHVDAPDKYSTHFLGVSIPGNRYLLCKRAAGATEVAVEGHSRKPPLDSFYRQMASASPIYQDCSAERHGIIHASERVHHNRCEDQRLNRLNDDVRYRSILGCLGVVSKPVKIFGLEVRRSGRKQAPSIVWIFLWPPFQNS